VRTPRDEREISAGGYVYNADGTRAERMTVYTSDYGYMLRFDRFVKNNPSEWREEEVQRVGNDIVGKRYSCPTSCLSFRSKTLKRNLTDKQKTALYQNLRN